MRVSFSGILLLSCMMKTTGTLQRPAHAYSQATQWSMVVPYLSVWAVVWALSLLTQLRQIKSLSIVPSCERIPAAEHPGVEQASSI